MQMMAALSTVMEWPCAVTLFTAVFQKKCDKKTEKPMAYGDDKVTHKRGLNIDMIEQWQTKARMKCAKIDVADTGHVGLNDPTLADNSSFLKDRAKNYQLNTGIDRLPMAPSRNTSRKSIITECDSYIEIHEPNHHKSNNFVFFSPPVESTEEQTVEIKEDGYFDDESNFMDDILCEKFEVVTEIADSVSEYATHDDSLPTDSCNLDSDFCVDHSSLSSYLVRQNMDEGITDGSNVYTPTEKYATREGISSPTRFSRFSYWLNGCIDFELWDTVFEYHTRLSNIRKPIGFSNSPGKNKGPGQKDRPFQLVLGIVLVLFCSTVQADESNLIGMEKCQISNIQCTIYESSGIRGSLIFCCFGIPQHLRKLQTGINDGLKDSRFKDKIIETACTIVLALLVVNLGYRGISDEKDLTLKERTDASTTYDDNKGECGITLEDSNTSFFDLTTMKMSTRLLVHMDRFPWLCSFTSRNFGVDKSANFQRLTLCNLYKCTMGTNGTTYFQRIDEEFIVDVCTLNGVDAFPLALHGFIVNYKSVPKITLKGTDKAMIHAYVEHSQAGNHLQNKAVVKLVQSSLIQRQVNAFLEVVVMCWTLICNRVFSQDMSDFVFKDNRRSPMKVKYKYFVNTHDKNRTLSMVDRKGFLKSWISTPWTSIKVNPLSRNSVDAVLKRYFSPSPPTKMETMAYEILRLCTMHDYPNSSGQSCIRLAQAGFFYEGSGDEVTCFSCGVKISGWNGHQDPLLRHRQSSPACKFARNGENNMPILHRPLETDEGPVYDGANSNDTVNTNETVSTNTSHVNESRVSEQRENSTNITASNGGINCTTNQTHRGKMDLFVSNPRNAEATDTCRLLQTSSSDGNQTCVNNQSSAHSDRRQPDVNNQGNTEIRRSAQHVQERSAVSSSTDSGPARYQPSVTTEHRARYPDYVLETHRVNSFPRNWTTSVNQTPMKMAKSGFFYAGYEDCVRCFDCGIGLRNWEYPDNPDVEHARWSPRCSFLIGTKGQGFIHSVLDAVARFIVRNENESGATSHANSGESVATSNGNSSEPGVASNGNSSEHGVASNGNLTEPGATSNGNSDESAVTTNGNSSEPGASSIVNSGQPRKISNGNSADTNTEGSDTASSRTDNHTEGMKEQTNLHSTGECVQQKQTEANRKERKNEKYTAALLKRGYSKEDIKSAIGSIIQAKGCINEENLLKELERSSKKTNTSSSEDIYAIKRKNMEIRKLTLCKICLEDEVGTVFLPCGHLVSCNQCSAALSRCAICRNQITGVVRAILDE